MASGWIKLHRKLMDSPMWTSEPFTKGQAWVDLLMLAEYETKGEYKRGSVYKSKNFLAARWKWDKRKVARFLDDLEHGSKDGTINRSTICSKNRNAHGTVVTIENYGKYQLHGTADGNDLCSEKCSTNGSENGNHLKKYKKYKASEGVLNAPSLDKKERHFRKVFNEAEDRWMVIEE